MKKCTFIDGHIEYAFSIYLFGHLIFHFPFIFHLPQLKAKALLLSLTSLVCNFSTHEYVSEGHRAYSQSFFFLFLCFSKLFSMMNIE